MLTAIPLIAVVVGGLTLLVYHRSGGRHAMAQPSGAVATSGISSWALAEAVALGGLVVAFLLSHPISFLPYGLASVALLVWTRPRAA